jgi:hypothetical protein
VADFILDLSGVTICTSEGTWIDSRQSGNTKWTIGIIRGASIGHESADPYITDDRGTFFDGINDFLTVRDLVIHHTFTMTFWMNPESSGTLYSSAMVNDKGHEQYWALQLEGKRFKFVDTSNSFEVLGKETYNRGVWQHLAFTSRWEEDMRKTFISLYNDGKPTERKILDFIIVDFRDSNDRRWLLDDSNESYNRHLIGATEFREQLKDLYTGFIYQWTYSNHEVTNYGSQIRTRCDGDCDICPNVGCLGECPSMKYPNEAKCIACPAFCTKGCQSNGQC